MFPAAAVGGGAVIGDKVGRLGMVDGQCRNQAYALGEAVKVVLERSDDAVAYRCGECDSCHVVGGRYARGLDVPQLMAEGRFIAG